MNLDRLRPNMYAVMETIRSNKRFLLIAHKKPDGDTTGSMTAMANVLDAMGKEFVAFCRDLPAPAFRFLPMVERITKDQELVLKRQPYDVVIVFDSGDLPYAGVDQLVAQLEPRPILINIDHHKTNAYYGDINVVAEGAASTTEVVAALLHSQGVSITQDIATCLLTGLVTDTGTFTNPATSVEALETASTLVREGGKYRTILRHLVANRSLESLRLWAAVFERLEIREPWGIAVTVITLEDRQKYGAGDDAAEAVANFLNSLGGVRAVMVLKELPDNKVKGSLRTTREDVDVASFAQFFGGGGHKKAAGFTVDGRLVHEGGKWKIQ